jgi:hypothetical protein
MLTFLGATPRYRPGCFLEDECGDKGVSRIAKHLNLAGAVGQHVGDDAVFTDRAQTGHVH